MMSPSSCSKSSEQLSPNSPLPTNCTSRMSLLLIAPIKEASSYPINSSME